MDRKEFLKVCGGSCVGLLGFSLTQSCSPTRHVQGIMVNNQLQIDKNEFRIVRNEKITYRKSVISKPDNSDYPIVIYRFSEIDYSALLLCCTHQSNELSMNGDILTCAAHGSEFNNRGGVIQGPAERPLQAFKVTTDQEKIYIQLS